MLRWLLLVFFLPAPLWAGAWMKEPGAGFLSFSAELSSPFDDLGTSDMRNTYSSFLEYGLTENLTIGYDATWSEDADKFIFYTRFPLQQIDGKTRYAFEVGTGAVNGHPSGYLGLMIGKSVTLLGRPGWVMLENRATFDFSDNIQYYKMDATLGITDKHGRKYLGQIQTEYVSNQDYTARLQGSIAWPLSKKTYIETGVGTGIVNDNDVRLKLGVWREF